MDLDIDYFMNNQDEYDKLTEEQLSILAKGGTLNADTEANAEEIENTAALETEGKVVEPVVASEPELLAKDGKHTIPYQELIDAREKAAQWEAFAAEQAALVESLRQAKAEDAGTGDTKAQEAVLAEYEGEFPEVASDMKPYIQAMIDAGVQSKVNAAVAAIEAKMNQTLAPMQKAAQDATVEAHFATIKGAVPDFDALVDSGSVQAWIKTQPGFVQAPANAVLEKGTAAEVIELFNAYKAANQKSGSSLSKEEIAKQAAARIAGVKDKTTTSLTDIPSGTIAPVDEAAAMDGMNASQLLARFEGKNPAEIMKLLAKVS
jgi:hypothetical protein